MTTLTRNGFEEKYGHKLRPLDGYHSHPGLKLPPAKYGPAIDGVAEMEDGTLWAYNVEYASQVAYCPVCGYEADTKPEADP